MTIKYAEVTIITNQGDETILRSVFKFLGYENKFTENDKIIISFDDETVCDVKDDYTNNNKFKFGITGYEHSFPIYFEMNDKTFFYKKPEIINNVQKLNFNIIMKNNKKYEKKTIVPSIYNVVFYIHEYDGKKDVFGILKIRSSEEKPRYHIAYDDKYFDKSSVIYLIDLLFRFKSQNENENENINEKK